MKNAKEILESIYKVYNPREEEEEKRLTGKDTYRNNYSAEDLRNMFIGTIMTSDREDFIKALRNYINKMPDEWVAEFLKVINGDVVEKVSESLDKVDIKINERHYLDNKMAAANDDSLDEDPEIETVSISLPLQDWLTMTRLLMSILKSSLPYNTVSQETYNRFDDITDKIEQQLKNRKV
jgi:ribosome-associated translation inhibitor RaiA